MKLKQIAIVVVLCLITCISYSQSAEQLIMMSNEIPDTAIQNRFPAFFSNYNYEKMNDSSIKGVYFGDFSNQKWSPAYNIDGYIFIDQTTMLKNNRLYENVVLWRFYQSIGSIHYRNEHPKIDSLEFLRAKFTFGLLKAKTLAENYNCGVLQAAISNIKYLSQNTKDKYFLTVVTEFISDPTYQEYVSFAKNCAPAADIKLEPIKSNSSSTTTPALISNSKPVSTVALDENAIQQILSSFRSKYDAVTETYSYYDKSSPKSNDNDGLFYYINRFKDGTFELRLRNQAYINRSEFKMDNHYLVKTDDETFDIQGKVSYYTDYRNDYMYGWIDLHVNAYIYSVINKLISSKEPLIRCYGIGDLTDNRKIKEREIESLKDVLNTFQVLTGGTKYK